MEIKDKISISKDFSDSPGARYRSDGPNSAQQFLEEHLLTKFEKAVEGNYILEIDLDGVMGYPSSFISGSFGKLSILKGSKMILKHIQFISLESNTRLDAFINEINKPKKGKHG
jgi:hypothetical protein